jgi:hypothetical protein
MSTVLLMHEHNTKSENYGWVKYDGLYLRTKFNNNDLYIQILSQF